ncbi:MAG: hypothetical protein IJJ33_13235 [Victivallales bacterium]|nr:hypothetical protein [Victivallales bacterium]
MKHLTYLFPRMEDFREERPRLRYEHIYGWLDGYGTLFDPVVARHFPAVAEWSNGSPSRKSLDGPVVCSSGAAATECKSGADYPGLFVVLDAGEPLISARESLTTPLGAFLYPEGLPYVELPQSKGFEWQMGGRNVLRRCDNGRVELGFELFSALRYHAVGVGDQRLLTMASLVAAALELPKSPAMDSELRLDCQAYGIARLQLQRLGHLCGTPLKSAKLNASDQWYLEAVAAVAKGRARLAVSALKKAFDGLAALRCRLSPAGIEMFDCPHAGVIQENEGYFELEWPEGARRMLERLCNASRRGYRFAPELGASCWNRLLVRYPDLQKELQEGLALGWVEIVNGTWSLPYSQVSPLAQQYRQFQLGQEKLEELFGSRAKCYVCQENAFAPQFPEMLGHFGYRSVMHFTQNHGHTPGCPEAFLWASPGGVAFPAFGVPDPKLAAIGINAYYDLPIRLAANRDGKRPLELWNLMDLSSVPLRSQTLRAQAYADVFGVFGLPGEQEMNASARARQLQFSPADYHFSADAFYCNFTNVNAISHMERTLSLATDLHLVEVLGVDTGAEDYRRLRELCCSYESHDSVRVQGQRTGDFFQPYRITMGQGPINPMSTLADTLSAMHREAAECTLRLLEKRLPQAGAALYNPNEIALAFAPVRYAERCSPDGLFRWGGQSYACGEFQPFGLGGVKSATEAKPMRSPESASCGEWEFARDGNAVRMTRNGQKTSFRVTDFRLGEFEICEAQFQQDGAWLTATLDYRLNSFRLSGLHLTLVTCRGGQFVDFRANYATSSDFYRRDRWQDYLAVTFECRRRCETRAFVPVLEYVEPGDKVISLNYVKVGKAILLNDGAAIYRRRGNDMDWLMHVADEQTQSRAMALAFDDGKTSPYLLSRAWATGLIPAPKTPPVLPRLADGLSLECLTPQGWLVCNVSGKPIPALPEWRARRLGPPECREASMSVIAPWQTAIIASTQHVS